MTTTNTQGAKPIQRFNNLVGIMNPEHRGLYVRYDDHAEALSAAAPVEQVIIDFPQVGTAGPFRVVNGRVSLPDTTMQDLVHMLRPTFDARSQQPAPSPTPAVGSRHPTVVRWRNDGIEACAGIAEVYGCDDAARDMRAMLTAAPTAQADTQPAPVEVADAMADSQYLAGVSAGWNAANAGDPNAALQKLHESRAGYLKPLRTARAPADSVLEDAARYRWLRDEAHPDGVVNDDIHVHVDSLHYPNRWALIGPELDAAVDAARKQGEKQ